MNSKKEVLVFGSGVSGLIVAHYLNKRGINVNVVDPFKSPILKTLKVDEGLVELAANSILFNESVKELLEELKLEYEFYKPEGKKKYFYRNGKLSRWPLNFFQTLFLLPFFIKLIFFKKKLMPQKNETLKKWAQKNLPKSFYERIFKRALQGVYGPEVDELSSLLILKNFFNAGKKSLGSVSFSDGMGAFTENIKSHLMKNGVLFLDEEPENFSGVRVVSTPAHSLPKSLPADDQMTLSKVSYHNISTLTLFFKEEDRSVFTGFGVVFDDEVGVLGLILNSDLFSNRAKEGLVSETWILDGRVLDTEEKALNTVLKLRIRMNKKENKFSMKAHYFKNWPKAFPVYDLKLEEALDKLQPKEDIFYFANWAGSLGIGKMIAKADEFSKKIEGAL